MYCVHLCTNPPSQPIASEDYHWLGVADGMVLLIHANCQRCQQPSTRQPHVLQAGTVSSAVASALASFGVVSTDTLLQAILKVAEVWPQAWP